MKPTSVSQGNAKRLRWPNTGLTGIAVKLLLVMIAAIGFVTGIGLGSVAAQQIAFRAVGQQKTSAVSEQAPEAVKPVLSRAHLVQRDRVATDLTKPQAVDLAEDDSGDLDEVVDDVVPG